MRALLALLVLLLGTGLAFATCGTASWYGTESCVSRTHCRTADGSPFDGNSLTAASLSLPLGAIIEVTDPRTGRGVRVRINDRGPARWTGRVLDLSRAAADALGIRRRGTARVCYLRVG